MGNTVVMFLSDVREQQLRMMMMGKSTSQIMMMMGGKRPRRRKMMRGPGPDLTKHCGDCFYNRPTCPLPNSWQKIIGPKHSHSSFYLLQNFSPIIRWFLLQNVKCGGVGVVVLVFNDCCLFVCSWKTHNRSCCPYFHLRWRIFVVFIKSRFNR